ETDGFQLQSTDELFEINQATPVPLLDTPDRNLLAQAPNADTLRIYDNLRGKMESLLASQPDCPGDGNIDGVVDAKDLAEWRRIAQAWGLSSVYDFMINGVMDGLTNSLDESVIQNNLGKTCDRSYGVYSAATCRAVWRRGSSGWCVVRCRHGVDGARRIRLRAGAAAPGHRGRWRVHPGGHGV